MGTLAYLYTHNELSSCNRIHFKNIIVHVTDRGCWNWKITTRESSSEAKSKKKQSVIRFGHGKVNWTTNKHKTSISRMPFSFALIPFFFFWNGNSSHDNISLRLQSTSKIFKTKMLCILLSLLVVGVLSSHSPFDVYLNGMNMRFYLKTSWNVRVSLKHNITLNNQIEVGKQFTRWFTISKTIVFNVY